VSSFGGRLRAARRRQGLSQEGLARLVDASKNSVQNWERASALPRCETVVALARALEVSSDYLLGLAEPAPRAAAARPAPAARRRARAAAARSGARR
jgi:transcriptional regulator with XRE-family HTH domain